MVNTRYGMLVVMGVKGVRGGTLHCRCDCGAEKDVKRHALLSGNSKSCGCRKTQAMQERNITHGEVKQVNGKRVPSPEYRTWQSMRNRCLNTGGKDYPYYGGRGVCVDPAWDTFEGFLESMGRRPSPLHSIDRIDGNLNYSKANCRWATRKEQARNRAYANVKAWEVAAALGLSTKTVYHMQWQVREKDKGNLKYFSLSPQNEARIRAYMKDKDATNCH